MVECEACINAARHLGFAALLRVWAILWHGKQHHWIRSNCAQVRAKPSTASAVTEEIVAWVHGTHPAGASGIVYCLTCKVRTASRCTMGAVSVLSLGLCECPPRWRASCARRAVAACLFVCINLKHFRWRRTDASSTSPPQETEALAAELSEAGLPAAPYHAQMDAAVRQDVHRRWAAGICTLPISEHMSPPASLSNVCCRADVLGGCS